MATLMIFVLITVATMHHLKPSAAFLFPDLKFRTAGCLYSFVITVVHLSLVKLYFTIFDS